MLTELQIIKDLIYDDTLLKLNFREIQNKLSNYDKFLQKIVFYDAIGELKKKNLYNFFYKIKKVFFTVYFFKGMYLFLKTFISR